jgi:predicted metal-dependent peptidase
MEEREAAEVARVAFMNSCPFYAHYFYSEMEEVFTHDVPTAATDGRRIFINPTYLAKLKPAERTFVYAHEVDHVICRDPQRAKTYQAAGDVDGTPFDQRQLNISMDYVINAGLVAEGIGMINPDWMWADDVSGDMVREEVYRRKYKAPPPGQGSGQGGSGGAGGSSYRDAGRAPKGAKGDPTAAEHGQDQVLPPEVDPITGREDLPTDMEFKEAVARAAAAAKAMGNMPDSLARKIEEILQPQVDWREHLRMLVTGRIGSRSETWNVPNRRRIVLNPMVFMPGRRGHGADTVVVAVDTSGSISQAELNAYLAEVGGVLCDVRPRRVVLIACDAQVQQVDEAASLDELQVIKAAGLKGGGGTSFVPVFERIDDDNLKPDAVIYCTDMMGRFPEKPPTYPVIWAATTDIAAPFGDVVRIKVGG